MNLSESCFKHFERLGVDLLANFLHFHMHIRSTANENIYHFFIWMCLCILYLESLDINKKNWIQTSSFAVISAALHYFTFCRWRKQVHENGRKSNNKLWKLWIDTLEVHLEPVLWGHWSHNKRTCFVRSLVA